MHARHCLLSVALIGLPALAPGADARDPEAVLRAELRRFAPSKGQVALAVVPSGVWPVPASRLSLSSRGQLRCKPGWGPERRIPFARALQLLPPGWLARSLAHLSRKRGRALRPGQLEHLQRLEQQVRRDNLRGLLARVGVSAAHITDGKLDRMLGCNLRLAQLPDGSSRVAGISVGERVRSTPHRVLQLDGSGALVSFGIEDMAVGEQRTSLPRTLSPAAARQQFSGLDLKTELERALRSE